MRVVWSAVTIVARGVWWCVSWGIFGGSSRGLRQQLRLQRQQERARLGTFHAIEMDRAERSRREP